MSIKIKIGQDQETHTKSNLEIRKTLDGNLIIFDHEDIDIVVSPNKGKVITFAKDLMDDKVYASQNRLMKYLNRKGVVESESIRAGNVYGSIEAKVPETEEEVNPIDMALLMVARWIEEERPYFMYQKAADQEQVQQLTDPDEEDSTELGQVPHQDRKGTLKPDVLPLGAQKPYLS